MFDPLSLSCLDRGCAYVEKNIEIRKARITKKRIVLAVVTGSSASPGHRDLVLVAPDYTQLVIENALRVTS